MYINSSQSALATTSEAQGGPGVDDTQDRMREVPSPDLSRALRGWWAVYTKHQHEKRVAEVLMHQGAEVFLPSYQITKLWNKRKVTLRLPLFPSYLFVREDIHLRLAVISAPGVHMIVSQAGKHAVIPTSEVENLRRAMQCPSGIQPHPFLKVGQRVQIVRGAMQGVEGVLLRHKGLCHVVLSVDMLAKSAVVEVAERDTALATVTSRTASPSLSLSKHLTGRQTFRPLPDSCRILTL